MCCSRRLGRHIYLCTTRRLPQDGRTSLRFDILRSLIRGHSPSQVLYVLCRAYVVYLTLREVATGGGPPEVKKVCANSLTPVARLRQHPPALFQAVDLPLKVAQTAAILEVRRNPNLEYAGERVAYWLSHLQVVHSMLGVVRSPFFTTCASGPTALVPH